MSASTHRLACGALVMLIAAAAFSPTASADQKGVILLTMESPEAGHVRVEQVRTDEDADAFRQSLDALFGNGDGNLTAEEAERIREATEEDLTNKSLPLVTVDGAPGVIMKPGVTFENAVGPVNGGGAIGIEHNLSLSFTAAPDADTHVITVNPTRDGVLTVQFPDGWTLAESSNLTDAQMTDGNKVGGKVTNATEVTLVMAPATADDAGAADDAVGPGSEVGKPAREVFALFAPLVLLAGVAGALLQKRGPRGGGRGGATTHPLERSGDADTNDRDGSGER